MTEKDKKIVISVDNVHKSFRLPKEKHTSAKQAFLGIFKKKHYVEQRILKGVSFEVSEGDFFGIVGRNGSGKSTLLKILAGIYTYDSGSVEITGKVSPFLELGVGFNPELTGWENIYLNGALLGLTRKEIDEKIDKIIEFSELREFMDQKLKNYSSGMQVRLAFSVAIHAHAPIILLDEVLAVGDIKFQQKCFEVFEDLKNQGRTIVFVTHSMDSVKRFCNKAMVIDNGKIAYLGDPNLAAEVYFKKNDLSSAELEDSSHNKRRYGNKNCEISAYEIRGLKNETVISGERFRFKASIKINKDVENLTVALYLRETPNENLYGINTYTEGYQFPMLKKASVVELIFEDIMPFTPGNYFLSVACSRQLSLDDYEDLDVLNNDSVITVNPQKAKEYWGRITTSAKISHKIIKGKK